MSRGLLTVLVVVGVAWGVAGVLLARSRATRIPGALTALTGALLLAALAARGAGPVGAAPELSRALVVAAGVLTGPLAVATHPSPWPRHRVDDAALLVVGGSGLTAVVGAADEEVVTSAVLVSALTLLAHLWWRLERADPVRRQELTWLCLGLAVPALTSFVVGFVAESAPEEAAWLTLAVVPVTMLLGVRHPHLVDSRALVVSTVVTGAALLSCVALYVTAVSILELLAGEPPPSGVQGLVAAGCAVALHPLRVLLHGVVDQLLFGHRPDPLHAATQLADGPLEDPAQAVRSIQEVLLLPYVALQIAGAELGAAGHPTPYTREIPLPGVDGCLVVGLRPGDLTLHPDDLHVLRLAAPLVAQTIRAGALNADLQQSRASARSALEEERRRIRRDLHDSLGPRLSGIAFTADAATNLLPGDPPAARDLVLRIRGETAAAVDDVRRLVYAMRPPALDELGLVGAIQQQAETLHAGGRRLLVTVDAAADLTPLPAAVEVASYRIVVEALTNVARHSGSPTARVTLRREDGFLMLSVGDAGVPEPARAWTAGVGLTSMRERAEEIGGRLTAGATPDGGRIEARLPIAAGSSPTPAPDRRPR